MSQGIGKRLLTTEHGRRRIALFCGRLGMSHQWTTGYSEARRAGEIESEKEAGRGR